MVSVLYFSIEYCACQISEGNLDVDLSPSDDVRHAETPALALEALQECALLIFKSQTEVAFREQSAGHNALLLFVYLTLQIMEQNLSNAFKELSAKQAEVIFSSCGTLIFVHSRTNNWLCI